MLAIAMQEMPWTGQVSSDSPQLDPWLHEIAKTFMTPFATLQTDKILALALVFNIGKRW